MIKKLIIVSLFLCSFLTSVGLAQMPAEAMMQVSVQVVNNNHIELPAVKVFDLTSIDEKGELGKLVISDLDKSKSYLESSEVLILQNEYGKEIELHIETQENTLKEELLYHIKSDSDMPATISGSYEGSYKISMVYL